MPYIFSGIVQNDALVLRSAAHALAGGGVEGTVGADLVVVDKRVGGGAVILMESPLVEFGGAAV